MRRSDAIRACCPGLEVGEMVPQVWSQSGRKSRSWNIPFKSLCIGLVHLSGARRGPVLPST